MEVRLVRGQPLRGGHRHAHVLDVGEALFEEELLREGRRWIARRRAYEPHRGGLGRRQRRAGRWDAGRTSRRYASREQATAGERGRGAKGALQQLAPGNKVAAARHRGIMHSFRLPTTLWITDGHDDKDDARSHT